MKKNIKEFLVLDGYPLESRNEFSEVGMTLAGDYINMLLKYRPNYNCSIVYTSDDSSISLSKTSLSQFDAILWPGCNLSVCNSDDIRVIKMLEIADQAFELGIPQFGSCWGLQVAVVVAGGKVEENPKGREMGIIKNFNFKEFTEHKMFCNRTTNCFDAFASHDDEVIDWPNNTVVLAGNVFTKVQAVEVKFKREYSGDAVPSRI